MPAPRTIAATSCWLTTPDGRELLGPLEVGPRERRGGFGLRDRAARRGELVGEIAGPHQGDQLPALDLVAAIDQHRVNVAEHLGAHVGLLEGTKVDGGMHFDRHIAGDDLLHDHQGRGAPLPFSGVVFGARRDHRHRDDEVGHPPWSEFWFRRHRAGDTTI